MKKGLMLGVFLFLVIVVLTGCGKKTDESQTNKTVNTNNTGAVNGDSTIVTEDFIQCLADNGMIIYGSAWCPACQDLKAKLGGDDMVKPIFVECTEEEQRCNDEMKDNYVPEIQINGELYSGQRDPSSLAEATGCKL